MAERKDRETKGQSGGKQAAENVRRAAEEAEAAAEQARGAVRQLRPEIQDVAGEASASYRDMLGASQENFGRIVESSSRLAQGWQEMSWEMVNFTQESMERSVRAANEMMTSRSVEDMVKIQQSYVRDSLDMMLGEGAKMMQLSSRIAAEAVESASKRQA